MKDLTVIFYIYTFINLIILEYFTFYFLKKGWVSFELQQSHEMTCLILIIEFHPVKAFSAPCRLSFYSKTRLSMFTFIFLTSLLKIVFSSSLFWYQIYYVYIGNANDINDTKVKISEVLSQNVSTWESDIEWNDD